MFSRSSSSAQLKNLAAMVIVGRKIITFWHFSFFSIIRSNSHFSSLVKSLNFDLVVCKNISGQLGIMDIIDGLLSFRTFMISLKMPMVTVAVRHKMGASTTEAIAVTSLYLGLKFKPHSLMQ